MAEKKFVVGTYFWTISTANWDFAEVNLFSNSSGVRYSRELKNYVDEVASYLMNVRSIFTLNKWRRKD